MIPPFAVSFSSSLRTRTRSCRGVILTVISLTSGQFIAKLKQLNFPSPGQHYGRKLFWFFRHATSRSSVCFLWRCASFFALLRVEFHSFRNRKLCLCIDLTSRSRPALARR